MKAFIAILILLLGSSAMCQQEAKFIMLPNQNGRILRRDELREIRERTLWLDQQRILEDAQKRIKMINSGIDEGLFGRKARKLAATFERKLESIDAKYEKAIEESPQDLHKITKLWKESRRLELLYETADYLGEFESIENLKTEQSKQATIIDAQTLGNSRSAGNREIQKSKTKKIRGFSSSICDLAFNARKAKR